MMNLFDAIRNDHDEIRELFESLSELDRKDTKGRLKYFDQLKEELLVHQESEEEIFYPLLSDEEELAQDMSKALEEHAAMRLLLRDIDRIDPTDSRWSAKLSVLGELFEHHAEQEEEEIFDEAQAMLDAEQAEETGNRFQRDKQRRKAGTTKPGLLEGEDEIIEVEELFDEEDVEDEFEDEFEADLEEGDDYEDEETDRW